MFTISFGKMEEVDLICRALLEISEDVSLLSATFKTHLDELVSALEGRDSRYTDAAISALKSKYSSVLDGAKSTASDIVNAAQLIAAEDLKAASQKCQTMVENVPFEAAKTLTTAREERLAWEAEKKAVTDIQKVQPKVKLDVGGVKFSTSLTTLRRFPDTMIGAMFSGRHAFHLDEEGYHFIDRDGTHFRNILNFLRSPETFECEITGASLKELKSECDYYGILELMFPTPVFPFVKFYETYRGSSK